MSRELVVQVEHIARRLRHVETFERESMGGSAFPTGISTGFRFFRTDLGWWCYYDGTRWLTAHEYTAFILINTAAVSTTNFTSIGPAELRTDYAPYITRCVVSYNVAATNNGSNYWTIDIRGINAAYTVATTIHTTNTSAATAGTWNQNDAAPSTSATPSNRSRLDILLTKTAGTPGNISCPSAMVYYRLIVT